MKTRILLSLSMALIGFTMMAQQLPLSSNYIFTEYMYNPAMSGAKGFTEASVIYRRQWVGVDGAPETGFITLNGSLNKEKIGYSLYGFNDKTDIMSRYGFYGNYAYHLNLSDNSRLSFGLSAGYISTNIDNSSLNGDPTDPLFNANLNGGVFDLNAGLNFSVGKFQIGASVPQLLESSTDFAKSSPNEVAFRNLRHYLVHTSYDFRFSGDKMGIKPFVIARAAQDVPFQIDGGLIFDMKDIGYVGGAYRQDYGVVANIGVHLNDYLTIGYAHDFSTYTYSSALGSTSEFQLTYRFGSNSRNERLEKEIKKLKQQQRQQKTETDEMVNEKLEEFKREMEAKNNKDQEAMKKEMEQNQTQGTQQGGQAGQQSSSNGQGGNQGGGNTAVVVPAGGNDKNNNNRENTTSNVGGYKSENYASNVAPGSKGFYVTAGVFGSQSNAEKLVKRLKSQGLDVNFFQDTNNNMYYVYLLKFSSYDEARSAKDTKLNGEYDGKLWVKSVE